MHSNISVTNTTKGKLTGLPFASIKEAVLGKKYSVSIVLCGNALSRRLNRSYRGKDKSTNVLSFPYSKNDGEIFLDLPLIKREAKKIGTTFQKHLQYLLIHGFLHLKGMEHGGRMDRAEKKFRKQFSL